MKNKGRDELEAEVARLREESKIAAALWQTTADYWRAACTTERAAHEATKSDLALSNDLQRAHRENLVAAEARVAELERDCYSNGHGALVVALEALDQARGLLERCQYAVPSVLTELLDAVSGWLRAHPAPKGNG